MSFATTLIVCAPGARLDVATGNGVTSAASIHIRWMNTPPEPGAGIGPGRDERRGVPDVTVDDAGPRDHRRDGVDPDGEGVGRFDRAVAADGPVPDAGGALGAHAAPMPVSVDGNGASADVAV